MSHFFVSALLDADDLFVFLFNSRIFKGEGEGEDNHPLYDKWRAEGGYKNLHVTAPDCHDEEQPLVARFTEKHRNMPYEDAEIEVGFFIENDGLDIGRNGDCFIVNDIPNIEEWVMNELYVSRPFFRITAMVDEICTD